MLQLTSQTLVAGSSDITRPLYNGGQGELVSCRVEVGPRLLDAVPSHDSFSANGERLSSSKLAAEVSVSGGTCRLCLLAL